MSDFSIDGFEVEVPCPKCGFFNALWLRQARLRDVIICRGCHSNVRLEDHMNEVRKAERNFRQAVRELEESLGSLEIRL